MRARSSGSRHSTLNQVREVIVAELKEVTVPDIGDFEGVEIIEVLVKSGDTVQAEDPLIMLESDKATMEVPAPEGGTVRGMKVKEGDKVSEGDVILTLEVSESAGSEASPEPAEPAPEAPAASSAQPQSQPQPAQADGGSSTEVRVPDIGDFEGVEIIEVMVKAGDTVQAEDPLIMLESDKATMEVPAPQDGTVEAMEVKEGDKVSEGDLILTLKVAGGAAAQPQPESKPEPAPQPASPQPEPRSQAEPAPAPQKSAPPPAAPSGSQLAAVDEEGFLKAHAGPSVRHMARSLGVDLSQVKGSGRKGRILQEDLEQHVRAVMQSAASGGAAGGGGALPKMPEIDFSQFGEIETRTLARIRKLSAQNLHRAWLVVPHVTQFDQADITELESFRKAENGRIDTKLTLLPFLIKAAAAAIDTYPEFASSLDPSGENLIMKHYRHIGFAVDTPNGLLVPVIRDVDRKGIVELAAESRELALKARDGKLSRADIQGGVFSISSLGGLGGTAFTPIVNAPEVAILGVSNSSMQPVWDGNQFAPRLMLPLSLSYDHRVIDGAKAARFTRYLADLLTDVRRLVL